MRPEKGREFFPSLLFFLGKKWKNARFELCSVTLGASFQAEGGGVSPVSGKPEVSTRSFPNMTSMRWSQFSKRAQFKRVENSWKRVAREP